MNPSRSWRRHVPAIATGVGAATIVVGVVLSRLGGGLGAINAPFYVLVSPRVSLWALPALGVVAAALVAARRLLDRHPAPLPFAAAALVLCLGMRLAVNAMREGPLGWHDVFGGDYLAQKEYLPALPALRLGVQGFLDRFAELSATLPIHPSAHPPGLVLTLHLLGIDEGRAMAALTIGVGALTAPLVYVLGRRLLDERRARLATLFYAFAPSSVLYGATSADALFATLATAAAAALVASGRARRALGAALLALASFFSYSLCAAGAWATLVVWRREGLRSAAVLAGACGVALLVLYAGLYAATGFDLPGSLEAANGAYRRGIASDRPYLYWLFGSPTAFFVALGLPLAWLALRNLREGQTTALALAAVVLAAALLGFTKAETERIWQFLVPIACLAAAAGSVGRPRLVLAAVAVQALVVQLVLNTRW